MGIVLRLIKWSWRAWPALVFVPLIFVHLLLIYYFCLNASATNKTISLFSQLLGGLLILYSIDSNIGIVKEKTLFSILANYFREFPLNRRSVVIEVLGTGGIAFGGKAKISFGRNPKNLEEKIEYLQEQIDAVKRDLEQESKELNEKINLQSKVMNAQIQEAKSALLNLESKMDEVSSGGIKVQLFGVLLMIYGSIAGYVV